MTICSRMVYNCDPGNPPMKRLEVSEKLRRLVLSRKTPRGVLLPPERSPAEQFGLSRPTLRRTVEPLVQEGRPEIPPGRRVYRARSAVVFERHGLPISLNLKLAAWIAIMAFPAFSASPPDEAASAITRSGGSCAAPTDNFIQCTRFSDVLGKEEAFAVQLPRLSDNREYCAILFLHGAGRNSLTLFSNPATRSIIAQSGCVIIFPNGKLSWWLDTDYGKYQSYVIELLDRLRVPLRLSSDARRHAVAGWSMGGFGSLTLIERYPERFAAWAGLLTLADFPNPAYPRADNYSVAALFGPPDRWPALNPLAHAENLRGKSLWFTTGSTAFDLHMNEALDRKLSSLGIHHEFHLSPGGHEFRVVAENLHPLLEFLEKEVR